MDIDKVKKLGAEWIDNCGDSSIRRMYGHHLRSFIAGAESQQTQIEELKAENEECKEFADYKINSVNNLTKQLNRELEENTKLKADNKFLEKHNKSIQQQNLEFRDDITKLKESKKMDMQYYYEYCNRNGYVTPNKWLTELKHY